ncbi:MAG: EAL domain-containing protein, partial [Acidimicrobiia bacterium]|nr:EAL domain-containing protein [Acidimicrobiia bacterium]
VVFVVLFYVAEITVVHVRFRRDAHSFSMSEVPLILSLFFLTPGAIIVTQFIGSTLALAFNRRQRSVKLAFNASQLTLQATVVIGIFLSLTHGADPLGPAGWLGVAAGVLATVVASNTVIGAAIRMSGGTLSEQDRNTMYTLSFGAAVLNSALALIAATIVWARPASSWIALIPFAVLFFAYRAYLAQRLDRDRLHALYEVSGELHRLPRIDDALRAGADRARSMFDAECTDVLLFPDGIGRPGLRTRALVDGPTTVMEPMDEVHSDVAEFVRQGLTPLLLKNEGGRGVSMVVAVPGSEPGFGAMVVRRPLSDIGSYAQRDLALLETLADHVGVSLKNGRLEDSLARLTELKDELHQRALHDSLTGLANRTLLFEEIERVLGSDGNRAAVMFIDLDDFKRINDTHGHETGDLVLIEVAGRLRSSCRPHDLVARLGGDEFALLLENLGSVDDAIRVAERIIRLVGEPIVTEGGAVETQASVGVAMIQSGDEPDDVLRRADEAMYAAKFDGKGCYRVHSPGMNSQHAAELATVTGLRQAIDRNELELHYQPLVDLKTREIRGIEALVRWNHPTEGLLLPAAFVPVAERRGLTGALGEWVLKAAVQQLADWHARHGEGVPFVSINLSADEISNDLIPLVQASTRARGVDPSKLQIEITESVMMTSDTTVLERLRALGVKVALDDFGTGYSSLAYLDRLPIDTIKFDQSFTARLDDARTARILKLMTDFGLAMGYETIAEGIETPDQLKMIAGFGCVSGQGYHLGRPMPAHEIEELLFSGVVLADVVELRPASNG